MTHTKVAPCGAWESPITSDLIVSASIGLSNTAIDGADLYWSEGRPLEGGRQVIVRRAPDGSTADVIAAPWYARSRVHEYGGGDWMVDNGTVYFSNFKDQRLYRVRAGEMPEALTPESAYRYADVVVDRTRHRLIAVREDHTNTGQEAVNTLVALDLRGDEAGGRVLIFGNNFYSTPCLSPDGARLAWLTWNHPNMPWDGTELWAAGFDESGDLVDAQCVAGGQEESIFQPVWSPDGMLTFASDRSNWWNLCRWNGSRIERLTDMAAEFGQPQWGLGASVYGYASTDQIVCAYTQNGQSTLASLDIPTRVLTTLGVYSDIRQVRVDGRQALFIAGTPRAPSAIMRLDFGSGAIETLRRSSDERFTQIDPGYVSVAQEVEFPTENGLTAYGFYYPPANRDYTAPAGEKPPLLVTAHGGPTGATSATFSLSTQYWTSRGFAVLDVNYGGSTGYGRAFRQRLNGQWGIVDIDDIVNGARYLADQGLVDGRRLSIKGGSAGGYTTLAALAFRNVFAVGASYYGISDLETLATDTHKFESRYLDSIVGPYPARRDIYVARSPIHFVDQIQCSMILFQGLEDKVVPPSQAVTIFDAVRAKGLPVAYVPYEGEGHGFRKAENIKHSLDAQLVFFGRVFGFTPAGIDVQLHIENEAGLPEARSD